MKTSINRRLKNKANHWAQRLTDSPHALVLLFFMSMAETIVVPIPMELVLVPYMVAKPERLWQAATVTFLGCLASSLIGYAVGLALYESVGQWFISALGYEQSYEKFQDFFNEYGFWAIVLIGLIPIPFQIAMIGAGSVAYPIHLFVLATLFSRGVRYYVLAALTAGYGDWVRAKWREERVKTSLAAIFLIATFSLGMRAIAARIF